ncbi:MAG: DUF4298 domain-containing protein [Oscillibacter sp.]|nr:DUF4298 domain-containing protein [Oscillibacter sp.]
MALSRSGRAAPRPQKGAEKAAKRKKTAARRGQLARIERYEGMMREAEALLAAKTRSEEETAALQGLRAALSAYYAGEEWKRDFADDEAGRLPKDLPRGVLSEDGLYELLERLEEAGLEGEVS